MTDRTAGYLPRGFRRKLAAKYVGVGLTKFDEMVSDGRMPMPRQVDGCRVWDRFELDQAFEELPHLLTKSDNPWDDV